MRQVPDYIIVGNGAVARHLIHYLQLMHIPYAHWWRGCGDDLDAFAVYDCPLLVAIKDDAIEAFLAERQAFAKHTIVHFSGALVIADAIGAHPLMTFTQQLYDLETYQQIPFILDNPDITFQQLFPKLVNPSYYIQADSKAYYHALCVMANNFTTLLWDKFFTLMKTQFAISPQHLQPFLQQTHRHQQSDIRQALSGPIHRGDVNTIKKNLDALTTTDLHQIYRAFVLTFCPGAIE